MQVALAYGHGEATREELQHAAAAADAAANADSKENNMDEQSNRSNLQFTSVRQPLHIGKEGIMMRNIREAQNTFDEMQDDIYTLSQNSDLPEPIRDVARNIMHLLEEGNMLCDEWEEEYEQT